MGRVGGCSEFWLYVPRRHATHLSTTTTIPHQTFDEFSFNPTGFGAQYTPDYVDLRAAGLAFLNVGLLNVQSPRVAPTPPNVGIGAYDDPLGAVAEAGVVLPSSVVVQGLCNVGGALGLACPPAWGTLSAFVRTPGTKGRLVQCASVSLGKLGGDLNQTTYLATEAAEFILKPCAAYGPADLFYLARTSALPGLPGDNTILLLTIDNLAVRGVRGGSVWEARVGVVGVGVQGAGGPALDLPRRCVRRRRPTCPLTAPARRLPWSLPLPPTSLWAPFLPLCLHRRCRESRTWGEVPRTAASPR